MFLILRSLNEGFSKPAVCPASLLLLTRYVVSDSSKRHGLQHARLLWPPLSPRICSSSWPLSWWCHPTISSSAIPFSSCLQSFSASGSFPRSQFFASGGQSIGTSGSTSVLPMVLVELQFLIGNPVVTPFLSLWFFKLCMWKLTSHTSKVMLKILQARIQPRTSRYSNWF